MSSGSFARSSVEKAQRELAPAPINPDWILEGRPQARYAPLSRLTDGRTWVDLWDCTAGRFHWYYACDETAHILEGEAVITDGDGEVWRVSGQKVWSTGRTPITGRQRVEAVEINGTVSLCGVQVRPGDLIVADDTGVCVIPQEHIAAVLERCQNGEAKESAVMRMLDEGRPINEIVATLPIDQW